MTEFLDIRTLSFTNLVFCFIYGFGLIIYSTNHKSFKGISLIGAAFLSFGTSFLLLGLRNVINDFMSIIIANFLSLFALSLIYEGLALFLNAKVTLAKFLNPIMALILVCSFVYYTYYDPNINNRIIIITTLFSIQSLLCSYLLFFKGNLRSGSANIFLGFIFLSYALISIFRAIWTLGESELIDFMDAGLVHALSLFTFQSMVLFIIFTVVWISSSTLEYELKLQARSDPLTKVYNRRALEEIAITEMARTIRSRKPLSMIMTDIDHFKLFNDTHGHQIGDKVLQEFAHVLKNNVREHDFVARYGGEEFIILLPETTRQQAEKVAEKLRLLVERHQIQIKKKKSLSVTTSFGIANFQEGMSDWKQIVKAADHALYDAKNRGRNCVACAEIGDKWASIKIK